VGNYEGHSRILWRLSSSGLGTTLTANGNSGPYNAAKISAVTAVDLRFTTDLALMVYVAGAVSGTTPSLVVNLDTYDTAGNLFPAVMATAAITATATGKVVYGGLFSGGSSQIVYPDWGRVSWTITGTNPSFGGVEISLYGR
jgi:hypothetical protein